MKKSMSSQSIQQAYATTTQILFNNINSKEYLQMSQESPVVSKYYSLVDNPQQYCIIIQSFDMLEFIFRLYKTKMIDAELWSRWEATAKSMITIGQLQTIEDDNRAEVPPGEMLRILMEDNGHIAKMLRNAITVCEDNRDSPTSNLRQDILDKTERRKWFLYEIVQGSKNAE
jgi:hypothetical protein